jgi:hypothetical protein
MGVHVGADPEHEGRDGQLGQARAGGGDDVEPAERAAVPVEIYSGLLGCLADRRAPQVVVVRVPAAPGKRHVAGPGVALGLGALDQKQLERRLGAQHHGHRRLQVGFVQEEGIVFVGGVRGERFAQHPEARIGLERSVRHQVIPRSGPVPR